MQDSQAETAGTPDPLVGDPNNPLAGPPNNPSVDPNDRAIAESGFVDVPRQRRDWLDSLAGTLGDAVDPHVTEDLATGSGSVNQDQAEQSGPGWDTPMRRELALVLSQIGFERDRQAEKYSEENDDHYTEFDWAKRRQIYELRLARDVGGPFEPETRDGLIKLAALCVAQLEAMDRRRAGSPIEGRFTSDARPVAFRDVVTHDGERDGFRVVREFVKPGLVPISLFIRTDHLSVSRKELATMSDESWRALVRDATRSALDKLTQRAIDERESTAAAAPRETERL